MIPESGAIIKRRNSKERDGVNPKGGRDNDGIINISDEIITSSTQSTMIFEGSVKSTSSKQFVIKHIGYLLHYLFKIGSGAQGGRSVRLGRTENHTASVILRIPSYESFFWFSRASLI
jgi:hypothetical protein